MKTLVLQPVLHDVHHFTADAQRRCGEGWRVYHPSVCGEQRAGKTVGVLEDSRRLYQSQLVNKWLALKRRTASLPVMSPAAASNGNYGVKRFRHQDRVPETIPLPIDPRSWTPDDVRTWLRHMTESHALEMDPSFFQMNGRGLCLMPLKGFLFRVPDRGRLLYEDFRGRLRRCLLAPAGDKTRPKTGQETETKSGRDDDDDAAGPSGQTRKPKRPAVSRVVVVEKPSKGLTTPRTYQTL